MRICGDELLCARRIRIRVEGGRTVDAFACELLYPPRVHRTLAGFLDAAAARGRKGLRVRGLDPRPASPPPTRVSSRTGSCLQKYSFRTIRSCISANVFSSVSVFSRNCSRSSIKFYYIISDSETWFLSLRATFSRRRSSISSCVLSMWIFSCCSTYALAPQGGTRTWLRNSPSAFCSIRSYSCAMSSGLVSGW